MQPTKGSRVSKLEALIAELVHATAGAEGAAVADIATGITLARTGEPGFDLDVAAQGFAAAVRQQLRTVQDDLGLVAPAEATLFTQGSHHHVIGVRTHDNREGLFVYLVVRRDGAALSAVRRRVALVARRLPL